MSFVHDVQQQQRVKVVAGYALQQRLGSGSFATVYKGIRISAQQKPQTHSMCDEDENDSSSSSSNTQRQDQQQRQFPRTVAIKAIARTSEKLTKKVLQNLEIEISILRTYRHPNIVCMHDVQKTDRHFYLILEYCGGGDVQHLIRSRRKGRLSERLTRRLMRDLASGLRFLWGQELIHRDIKPQNLLLTGPLPMEELEENPPAEEAPPMNRSIHDDPGVGFSLKIADFGFARHLQTASLAETLCGSPLYMAPEILQHHRYDAKADLWSVGTVLFEMIAGRPPFNGENHIDLLRNIQRKAVRLPPDVRVSKACVNLLRILLNRNPLSRAGFKEFFSACDAFVDLGCGGDGTYSHSGIEGGNDRLATKDLGTIHENDHGGTNAVPTDSLMTVDTTAEEVRQEQSERTTKPSAAQAAVVSTMTHRTRQQQHLIQSTNKNTVSPDLSPSASPSSAALIPSSINLGGGRNGPKSLYQPPTGSNRLEPLTSSPPTSSGLFYQASPQNGIPPPFLSPTSTSQPFKRHHPHQQIPPSGNNNYLKGNAGIGSTSYNINSISQSQASSNDESGFVMVEYTKSPSSSQHFYATGSQQQPYRNNTGIDKNELVEHRSRASKGMLSTSPGTGKMLLGMMGRATIGFGVGVGSGNSNLSSQSHLPKTRLQQFENTSRMAELSEEIAVILKMIATAEDVGRRAVTVAHLGDNRVYLGMRLLAKTNEEGSSLLSSTPMEGVEEAPATCDASTSVNLQGFSTDNSNSTETMGQNARKRSSTISCSDKEMAGENSVEDEMPFAISPEAPSVSLPSRTIPSAYNRSSSILSMKKSFTMKASPQSMLARFKEALSCYLKSLKMLKGAVGASQRVASDLKDIEKRIDERNTGNNAFSAVASELLKLKQRCEITSNWLCNQFRGVLERADAANVEISKLNTTAISGTKEGNGEATIPLNVEELIYNHALAAGRDGAVKHLLGQYEAARSCYRSAGLLAETLLMEINIEVEDRKILESYVDGFAAKINELDQLMVQQSRMTISSSNATQWQSHQSRRSSGIVGLIGPSPIERATGSTPFVVGSPR